MGKDSGPSQPSSQSVSQTSIPEYAKPYVERMLGKSEALANTPYQPYQGQRLAGFTPMQQEAFARIQGMEPSRQLGVGSNIAATAGLGSLNAGYDYARAATNPGIMQAYMSPYMQNVVDISKREAGRQSEMQGQQNAAQAVQAGAFGGSRFGLQEAERQRNLAQQMEDIQSRGMQSAFDKAQQAQQFGATLGLQGLGQAGQAAATLGQLGGMQFGQQKDIVNALQGAGAVQQNLEQQRLQQQYQDFLNQRGYQQQQLGWFSDMLRGLPLTQQTQQIYQAPPSFLSQASGLGLAAYGMSKAEGGVIKDDNTSAGLTDLLVHQIEKG